eukprot:2036584-Alexandrium_andersonii.AAC.1
MVAFDYQQSHGCPMPYEALDVVRNERTTTLRSLHHPLWVRLDLAVMQTSEGKLLVLDQSE